MSWNEPGGVGKSVGKGQGAVGKGYSYRDHESLLELQKFKAREYREEAYYIAESDLRK